MGLQQYVFYYFFLVKLRNNCLLFSCLGKTYGVGGTLYKYMTEKIENSTDERRNNCLLLSCLGKTYGVGGTLYKYMTQKIENSTNPSRQSRSRRLMMKL